MIEIRYNGRLVLTTAQAAEARRMKPGSFRAWVHRHGLEPATHLDPRTPLYYAEEIWQEVKER